MGESRLDVSDRDEVESGAAAENLDVRGGRRPHRGIGGAEEEQARDAARSREVANAAVVAEEEAAVREARDEFAERELVSGCAERRQGGRGSEIGFAGDEEKIGAALASEPGAELDPAGEGPVFLRGAATGVNGDEVGVGGGSREWVERGRGRQTEGAERFAIVCRGRGEGRERGRSQKSWGNKITKMTGEGVIGIGPEIDDEIGGRELGREVGGERGVGVERAPARFVLGIRAIKQAGVEGEGGGGGVADELEAGAGPAVAQEREGGECDDEIAEGAASKEQNFSHPGRASQSR